MQFRFLTAEDAPAYWDVRLEALESEPQAFGSSPEEHRALTFAEVAARIAFDPLNKFTVGAFLDGRLVGTAGFYRDRSLKSRHKGHVWGVYVSPNVRRSGAGRNLLRILLEHAAAIDEIEQIMLSVATGQKAATSLYRSFGFAPYGCEQRALKVGDRYLDEEHMVLIFASFGKITPN
jgi:ribosomal protein S18 acetylase RimI-like enzyme